MKNNIAHIPFPVWCAARKEWLAIGPEVNGNHCTDRYLETTYGLIYRGGDDYSVTNEKKYLEFLIKFS